MENPVTYTRVVHVGGGGGRPFVANVLGDDLAETIPVEESIARGRPEFPVGDEGVRVLYGDSAGVTCALDADDELDAERRIVATFGDAAQIDDLQSALLFLDADDLVDAADALQTFAGIDEGEHVDVDRLEQLATRLRGCAGRGPTGKGFLAAEEEEARA